MKLYVQNNSTSPSVTIIDDISLMDEDFTPPYGFTEFNKIESWFKYGKFALYKFKGFNYITWRKQIQSLIIQKVNQDYSNWNLGLSDKEKDIAIELVLAPYSLRVSYISDEQDKINWINLIQITQGIDVNNFVGRAKVIEKMRELVGDELRIETMSKSDIDLFYKDTYLMLQYYISSNSNDFKNWLNNEIGSIYELDGFKQKSYYSEERKIYLLNIANGNY